jgi:hypothetical protein
MGHDAADRQRGEPARDERDELPGGHAAAAVLRPLAAGGHGLRRDRGRDRPRDQPQLRRLGAPVRRRRPLPELVDGRGQGRTSTPPPPSS